MGRSRERHRSFTQTGHVIPQPYRAFPRLTDGVDHPVISRGVEDHPIYGAPVEPGSDVYLDNDGRIVDE